MSDNERVGILEAKLDAHFRADETAFTRIYADTSEIKETLRLMSTDLKSAVERIHSRIDDEANVTRTATAGVASEGRNNANLALQAAQAAADGVKDAKIWALTSLGAVLMTVLAWAANRIMGGAHTP